MTVVAVSLKKKIILGGLLTACLRGRLLKPVALTVTVLSFLILYSALDGTYGILFFFFSSRRRHTRFSGVTGVQTCALPILSAGRRHTAPHRCACRSPTD